jgi:GntR family transcriptional regulator, transcriptional repressor for pyruvate dehydrogenase complex
VTAVPRELAEPDPTPPRREKRSEVVARRLVADIVDRRLPPGTMLPSEAVMLKDYGVGRTSLREAIRILEIHGLVRIRPGPGGGPMVAEADSHHFGSMMALALQAHHATYGALLEAQVAIEPVMVRLAAKRDPEIVAPVLRAAIEEAERAYEEADDLQFLEICVEFHVMLGGLSGNRILDLYGQALNDLYFGHAGTLFREVTNRRLVLEAHKQIADAILQRRPQAAAQLMRAHLARNAETFHTTYPDQLQQIVVW